MRTIQFSLKLYISTQVLSAVMAVPAFASPGAFDELTAQKQPYTAIRFEPSAVDLLTSDPRLPAFVVLSPSCPKCETKAKQTPGIHQRPIGELKVPEAIDTSDSQTDQATALKVSMSNLADILGGRNGDAAHISQSTWSKYKGQSIADSGLLHAPSIQYTIPDSAFDWGHIHFPTESIARVRHPKKYV